MLVAAIPYYPSLTDSHQDFFYVLYIKLHMHLIPRYQTAKNNDILMWSHENFSDEEMAQIRDSLSRN